jgi:hypothetical protein
MGSSNGCTLPASARGLRSQRLGAVDSTYRIEFQEWYPPSGLRDVRKRSPGFRVWSDLPAQDSGLFVGVVLSRTASTVLLGKLGLKVFDDEDGPEVDEFLLMHGVQVITERLRDGTWQAAGLPQEILVDTDELDGILAAQIEKQCDYQQADGRDLYCLAAARNDETLVGTLGMRFVAPTSRSTCAACSMPDSRLVCSHLHHPQVFGHPFIGGPTTRDLGKAFCDIGREEVANPRLCKAGGHECWTSIVEPLPLRVALRSPPRALLEAFDYLDTSWRLAFGRPLVVVRTVAGTADITEPCSNREEFQSRLSAVGELLKAIDVSDDLLKSGDTIPKDLSLARLRSCLSSRLEEEELERAEGAADVLFASTRVRAGLQHEDAAAELPSRLAQLGVAFPPADWGDAWEEVRSRLTAAVGDIAEVVRTLAVAE